MQVHHSTTLQQRIEIWERVQQGETDTQIAAALGLRSVTVRKWRRRAKRCGRSGLASVMGRPACGVLSHFVPAVGQVLRELRQAHPGWGPKTLRLECAQDARLQGHHLPSRSRIAAFLKSEKLTRRYERHTTLSQPPVPLLNAPHIEWELDAQGVRQVTGAGKVSVINLGDPYSHVRTGSQACVGKSKADTADYQLALRRAFLRYGLPQGLSLDHDSAFFDNTSASPYPSQLHLWVIALGMHVRFIDVGRPTQHGFIERTHQILDAQTLRGYEFDDATAVQPALDRRLDFLNRDYPSRALHERAPLTAFPAAHHSGRLYQLEAEEALLDMQRVYDYLSQQRWFRHVSAAGQFTLGTCRYGLGKTWGNQTIEIHFDPATQEIVCSSADAQVTKRLQAQGVSKRDLMGELDMNAFPHYQYAFPWSLEACRRKLLCADMRGTTL
jgi:hypothetical protein